jgi:diguanylate cyclase (GGDEF)-like protein/PAS domain S-box-containing protein
LSDHAPHQPEPATADEAATGHSLFEVAELRLYRRIVADSSDHISVLDRNYVYRLVNQSYLSSHGRGEAEIVGRGVADLFGQEVFEALIKPKLERCFAGEVVRYQAWFEFKASGRRYMNVTYTPYRDHAGSINGAIVSARDLTELYLVQEALSVSEARNRAILDTAVDGILVVDEASRVAYANPATCLLTGYSREELQDRPLTDLMPESYRGRHEAGFGNYLVSGQPTVSWRNLAFVLLHRDGHEIPVEVSIGEQGGTESRLFIGILRDVTARRAAEERLRQSAKVFESTTDGVTITDAAANIIAANRAFSEITGYTEAEVLGKNPRLLQSGRHDESFYRCVWQTIARAGAWSGEIWNRRKNGEIYPEWLTISSVKDDAGELTNYVGVFSDISQIKQSQEQLEHLAHYDPLTDLPNRLLFGARLEHAIQRAERDGALLTLLYIDLDRFKTVNEGLGHPAGDRMLREVAQRLAHCVRAEDTVARLGGDEFIIMLEGLQNTTLATALADKLLAALTRSFDLDGQEVFIGASIGISTYPADGTDATTLLKNADAAMYRSKEDGRNTHRFYNVAMTRSARERLTLETSLRQAVAQQEFLLHYQPQVDVASGEILGVEALVRWDHPASGLIAPVRFIPLAEETGLIIPLGEWVLFAACAQAKIWSEQVGMPRITVAVNLSPRQFRQEKLAEHVRAVLDATGLPPALLELEITESALMDDAEQAIVTLRALKQLGIRVSMDDFGTGYSSLAQLKRFPIDKLKIDQSFIRDIPHDQSDMEIAATIVAMARNLHLKVLAEGVETEAQLAFLQIHGCDAYQGYLCSRPVPAQALEAWLAAAGKA